MNVIVLGPSYKRYLSASYQYAFEEELKLISSNFFHYSNSGDISTKFIDNLYGSDSLRSYVLSNKKIDFLIKDYKEKEDDFRKNNSKYLLYK